MPRTPPLVLPGFLPDAVSYALRTTTALLLAYAVSFAIQLDAASTAGVCVAIVSAPTPGMAVAKASWRIAGTLVGGVAAMSFMAAFPQDRTMLLAALTLWLGACTFVAAQLRDFRAYGAVLSGYTAALIALSEIDTPTGTLIETLNRIAAILIGIMAVALVNTVTSRALAYETLLEELETRLATMRGLALGVTEGHPLPREPLPAQEGAAILALRTEANYAAAELVNGRARRAGATTCIAGLLGVLTTARALATALASAPGTAGAPAAAFARAALCGTTIPARPVPATTGEALVLDRAAALAGEYQLALHGLQTYRDGAGLCDRLHLPEHRDPVGALLSALRTMIAVGLASVFCVYGGWDGASLVLIMLASFTSLLGMQPNPSAAGLTTVLSLPLPCLAVYVVNFGLLPQASGFVPFALAIGAFAFAFALAARHPATQRFGAPSLLYFTLLLSPANPQVFDLASYMNQVVIQTVVAAFLLLSFRLILPVSPRRRLERLARAILRQLAGALRGEAMRMGLREARVLRVDRLAQVQVWLGRLTPGRRAVLERLTGLAELEAALRRAALGLRALGRRLPPPDPAAMEALAQEMLRTPDAAHAYAAAGLADSAVLLRRHARALRLYGLVPG